MSGGEETAVDNARHIVNDYANCSDYAKLYGYATEICTRVSYNHDATVLNGQGKYTVTDVTRFYESSNPLNQTEEGDVTGDGKIDIADVNAVINIMLGK